ncbi:MAG: nucleotide sugar dehydrogenase [Gammaproteobacteria bacterium]|nr:nucleotide sugar dehydrogenase [Gammaproteobacteria bacterium]
MVNISRKIAVIGLGYVGLPVAVHFGKHQRVIGFDIAKDRIEDLQNAKDYSNEISPTELNQANILFTHQEDDLQQADFYIISVPTPIDNANKPDLRNLIQASKTVAKYLKQNDIVIYESTVYPGTTEEECLPVLESISGLRVNNEFSIGYCPERISPGDKEHTFEKVIKIVSASNQEALNIIYEVYNSVVTAGVHKASSIKVAEAAKVIENTQRDINVALMNELSIIFDKLGIDTNEVLSVAKTKWNFQAYTPGLVGGHCIGVDPYYLTYKAQTVGYHPEVILAGRRINDSMGKYVAAQTIKKMLNSGAYSKNASVAVLGMTFKEDCSDIRNSKVIDIIHELESFGINVKVHDPIADFNQTRAEYQINLVNFKEIHNVQALIIAVGHRFYKEMTINEFVDKLAPGGVIVDVKGILDHTHAKALGVDIWRL